MSLQEKVMQPESQNRSCGKKKKRVFFIRRKNRDLCFHLGKRTQDLRFSDSSDLWKSVAKRLKEVTQGNAEVLSYGPRVILTKLKKQIHASWRVLIQELVLSKVHIWCGNIQDIHTYMGTPKHMCNVQGPASLVYMKGIKYRRLLCCYRRKSPKQLTCLLKSR